MAEHPAPELVGAISSGVILPHGDAEDAHAGDQPKTPTLEITRKRLTGRSSVERTTPLTTTTDTSPVEDAPQDETSEQAEGKRAQRERARAAEARAVAAEERLAKLQRQAVASIARTHLAVGDDVLNVDLGGVELDALLDDDGVPDPELVKAAAAAMVERRPGLAPIRRSSAGSGSPDGGVREAPPRRRTGWSDILGGRQ